MARSNSITSAALILCIKPETLEAWMSDIPRIEQLEAKLRQKDEELKKKNEEIKNISIKIYEHITPYLACSEGNPPEE